MYRILQNAHSTLRTRTHSLSAGCSSLRLLSTSRVAASEHHEGPPQLYGPGAKNADTIPTDQEQATGLERYQLLGKMEGVDVFDMKPLESGRLGTIKNPIMVQSFVSFYHFL